MNNFENELIKLKNDVMNKFNKDEAISEEIVNRIFKSYIIAVASDIHNLSFTEFYKKYINGMSVFQASDFTKTQIQTIIDETPLTERDRNIARLYFIELKSEDYIADKLMLDKKTVRSNLVKIRGYLNSTCCKLFSR